MNRRAVAAAPRFYIEAPAPSSANVRPTCATSSIASKPLTRRSALSTQSRTGRPGSSASMWRGRRSPFTCVPPQAADGGGTSGPIPHGQCRPRRRCRRDRLARARETLAGALPRLDGVDDRARLEIANAGRASKGEPRGLSVTHPDHAPTLTEEEPSSLTDARAAVRASKWDDELL